MVLEFYIAAALTFGFLIGVIVNVNEFRRIWGLKADKIKWLR